jgi:hypothetical protein
MPELQNNANNFKFGFPDVATRNMTTRQALTPVQPQSLDNDTMDWDDMYCDSIRGNNSNSNDANDHRNDPRANVNSRIYMHSNNNYHGDNYDHQANDDDDVGDREDKDEDENGDGEDNGDGDDYEEGNEGDDNDDDDNDDEYNNYTDKYRTNLKSQQGTGAAARLSPSRTRGIFPSNLYEIPTKKSYI